MTFTPQELKTLAEQALSAGSDRWIALPARNLLELLLRLEALPPSDQAPGDDVAPC